MTNLTESELFRVSQLVDSPTTILDKLIGSTSLSLPPRVGAQHALCGLRNLSPEFRVNEDRLLPVTSILGHRRELRFQVMPTSGAVKAVLAVLNHTHSIKALAEQRSKTIRTIASQQIDGLENSSKAQTALLRKNNPSSVLVRDDLQIVMSYSPSQWEGLGGVYFWAQSDKLPDLLPLYAVRGNPELKDDKLCFNFRVLTSWVSEEAPSIAGIKRRYHGLDRMDIESHAIIDFIVSEQARVMDVFLRTLAGKRSLDNSRTDLKRHDVFLLSSLAYLQKIGVTKFQGITHNMHPVVTNGGKIPNYNFDELFSRHGFSKIDDPVHPWALDTGVHDNVHIPHWNSTPPVLRNFLVNVVQQQFPTHRTIGDMGER